MESSCHTTLYLLCKSTWLKVSEIIPTGWNLPYVLVFWTCVAFVVWIFLGMFVYGILSLSVLKKVHKMNKPSQNLWLHFLKSALFYCCYYPHTLRDSVLPVCGIFSTDFKEYFRDQDCHFAELPENTTNLVVHPKYYPGCWIKFGRGLKKWGGVIFFGDLGGIYFSFLCLKKT